MLELFTELDQRRRLKHSLGRHDQEPILHAVQVAHDQQQVVGLLHGQEPRPDEINIFRLVLTDREPTFCHPRYYIVEQKEDFNC
jgi:hypothetical protein